MLRWVWTRVCVRSLRKEQRQGPAGATELGFPQERMVMHQEHPLPPEGIPDPCTLTHAKGASYCPKSVPPATSKPEGTQVLIPPGTRSLPGLLQAVRGAEELN